MQVMLSDFSFSCQNCCLGCGTTLEFSIYIMIFQNNMQNVSPEYIIVSFSALLHPRHLLCHVLFIRADNGIRFV